MLVSYNWLNKYFDGNLPEPEKVAEALTFHAWEIEELKDIGNDTILDVGVLPDKAMWALSHRGIAKDLSVIFDMPLSKEPITEKENLEPQATTPVDIKTSDCRRFATAHIKNIKVGPSPKWLKDALEAVGQRSINNVVDASNYVMLDLGQPSHAFDASKVGESGLLVRQAKEGEKLVGLDEKEYEFTESDLVITRQDDDEILSIAGLKGGKDSGVSNGTTEILVEVANWHPLTIRKTGQRIKLRTDASARYENGIVPEMVPYGIKAVTNLILEIAGGELVGYTDTTNTETSQPDEIMIDLVKINSVLGLSLSTEEVGDIIKRFGWEHSVQGEVFSIRPPFYRSDLVLVEDIIEEIGRIYGYTHIPSIEPTPVALTKVNKRFYYSDLIRDELVKLGWSEVYTSSFRAKDEVKLSNALASDKGYLRSTLVENINDSLTKNVSNADLLGLRQIKIFEIGTVFKKDGEQFCLSLGVRSPAGYKAKLDEPVMNEAVTELENILKTKISETAKEGILEIDLEKYLSDLPDPVKYNSSTPKASTYNPFSLYPAIARDIAMWTTNTTAEEVEKVLNDNAGELRVRTTLFDEFSKDNKTSYAFRLIFQAPDRTLTDEEVNGIADKVYKAIEEQGWEVR